MVPADSPPAPPLFRLSDFDLADGLEILRTIRKVTARRAMDANVAPGSRRTVDG